MPPRDPIAPTPAQEVFLTQIAAVAGHGSDTAEELEHLKAMVTAASARHSRDNRSARQTAYAVLRDLARTALHFEQMAACYLTAGDIAAGAEGPFDARSMSAWLAIANLAGVPAVPATEIVRLPEPLLAFVVSPELTESPPTQPSALFQAADLSGKGALTRAFHQLDEAPVEMKRRLRELALAALEDAAQRIPSGWMVRHDHMGPGVLKAFAALGRTPTDGDDGAAFADPATGRHVTLGPGWLSVGNRRYVDVTDARTVKAISQALTPDHAFYARPWITARRRFGGLDIHRPASWSDESRQGTWPAEWRVHIRAGSVVAVSAYYAWADVPNDPTTHAAIAEAVSLGQRIADTATSRKLIPSEPHLEQLRHRSAEVREHLPPDTVCAALDFIETADGLMLLEGAPPYAPGGYGAHPCAHAGERWPTGFRLNLRAGIDLTDLRTWGPDALAPCR